MKWNSSIASSKNKVIQDKIYSDSDSDDDWDSCVEKVRKYTFLIVILEIKNYFGQSLDLVLS